MTPAGQPGARPADLPGHPIGTTAMTVSSATATVGTAHDLPAARPVIRAVRGISDQAIAWWFILPSILLLLAINIFPLLWTIYLSFTDYRANQPGREIKWIGLRNYERLLASEDVWGYLQVTAHFVCWSIFFQVVLGLGLATRGGPGTTWGVTSRGAEGWTACDRPVLVRDPEGLERRGVRHDPQAREDQQLAIVAYKAHTCPSVPPGPACEHEPQQCPEQNRQVNQRHDHGVRVARQNSREDRGDDSQQQSGN